MTPDSVAELIAQQALQPHFQPIVQLSDGVISKQGGSGVVVLAA